MALATRILGALLVLSALVDIYLTVLFCRSRAGFIGRRITRAGWSLFRAAAAARPRLKGRILEHAGPVLLVVVTLAWVLILLVGFALILLPDIGRGLQAPPDLERHPLATALLDSGYTLTTLGAKDLTPQTFAVHTITILESACGFAVFTLTLTYLLSMYSAILRTNQLALRLHHAACNTADAAELITSLCRGGDYAAARQALSSMANEVLVCLESYHFYPAITYFRFDDPRYCIARMHLIILDTHALVRACIDPARSDQFPESSAVSQLWTAGMQSLKHLNDRFLPPGFRAGPHPQIDPSDIASWEHHYRAAVARFRAAGIPVKDSAAGDPGSDGLSLYLDLRRCADPTLKGLASYLMYTWEELAPADAR